MTTNVKPPLELSLLKEDIRANIFNENGTFCLTCFPSDATTRDWLENRRLSTPKEDNIAASQLQWSSYGVLEFMENENGALYIVKERRRQIIFRISTLTDEHIEVLKIRLEKKHKISITHGQIHPVRISGFQASLSVVCNHVKRIFVGTVRNLDAIRPLECVFDFATDSDMQLALEELQSSDGATLSCCFCFGGIQFERSSITILKQKLTDCKLGDIAFGPNNPDYALFTSSQMDELAQIIVNNISMTELANVCGSLVDMQSLVLNMLQPEIVDTMITEPLLAHLSPLNNEASVLLEKITLSLTVNPDAVGIASPSTSTIPPSRPPIAMMSSNSTSHAADAKHSLAEKDTSHVKHHHLSKDDVDAESVVCTHDYKLAPGAQHKTTSPSHHQHTTQHTSSFQGSQLPNACHKITRLFRIYRLRATENMMLQWNKINSQYSAICPQIEIETSKHICRYGNEIPWRELPAAATNLSVLRLYSSAWVYFTPPLYTGTSRIEQYTVHAKVVQDALMDDTDVDDESPSHKMEREDDLSNDNAVKSIKYARTIKIRATGTQPPILVTNLHPSLEYRFKVESHNVTSSSKSDGVIAMRDNESFATVPLYGIIMYSGPKECIPHNYRLLDGTDTSAPNLGACFSMKTDVIAPVTGSNPSAALSGSISAPAKNSSSMKRSNNPKWYGLSYIQRIA